MAEVKLSQPLPEKAAISQVIPPPPIGVATPSMASTIGMQGGSLDDSVTVELSDESDVEMIWVKDEDEKATKPFKLVPKNSVSVTGMVAPADRFDLTSDPFEVPKEYFEGKDASYYQSMETRWSSKDELEKGIAQRAGYSAVKEARGLKMTMKDGCACNGTMMLVHRPRDVGRAFDIHTQKQIRMKMGESEESIDQDIEGKVNTLRSSGAPLPSSSGNFDFFEDNFGEKSGGRRFAGGQGGTPEFEANEARAEARARGGKVYGGFDGRMGARAVPESPYLRNR